MSDELSFSDLTTGEKLRIAALIARMGKRGMAGDGVDISDLKRRVQRIENTARTRKQQPKK